MGCTWAKTANSGSGFFVRKTTGPLCLGSVITKPSIRRWNSPCRFVDHNPASPDALLYVTGDAAVKPNGKDVVLTEGGSSAPANAIAGREVTLPVRPSNLGAALLE